MILIPPPHTYRKVPMTRYILIAIYLVAIAAANLIATEVGPQATVYTALGLVALDLVLRDALHDRFGGRGRLLVMALLVAGGALIAYTINADAQRIALASACAFAAALTVDGLVYHAARRLPWIERSNLSNIAGAIIDSAVFIAVAFPGFLWPVFVGQTTAKIAGGLIFAMLLERFIPVGHYLRVRGDQDAQLAYAPRR